MGIGSLIAPDSAVFSQEEKEIKKLSDEQLDFLRDYESWLTNFDSFIETRNSDPFNIANNKKLMELSAEAETRKPVLEKYMQDEVFAAYFNFITKKISEKI